MSLINGTQFMTAMAALLLIRARRLARAADIACAMSLEALQGTPTSYHPAIHAARPLPGQAAERGRAPRCSSGSAIVEAHRWCDKVQDAYSLRCAPQVHGASRDLIDHVERTVAIELNAATDNPLVLLEESLIVSNGNFHGQPIAIGLDCLAIACAELASISERRTERLVNPSLSDGLPPFLVTREEGLNSGFMIPQYVAAALVSENKALCHPASVDSIPTSAGQEDHVSMGNAAGLKALQVVANAERALAIELLAGAQAVEFLAPLEPGVRRASRPVVRPDTFRARARGQAARPTTSSALRRRFATDACSRQSRRSSEDAPVSDLPPPRQPYRAAVVVHGGLAAVIVLVAAAHRRRPDEGRRGRRGLLRRRDGLDAGSGSGSERHAPPGADATRVTANGHVTDACVEHLVGDLSVDPCATGPNAARALVADRSSACGCSSTTSTRRSPSIQSRSSSTAARDALPARTTHFASIVRTLLRLRDDETLLVQSGKPVGVFRTHAARSTRADRKLAPRARMGVVGRVPATRGRRG